MLTPANGRDMAQVLAGGLQARGAVRELGPDAVLATGGYVAIPVGLAAACAVSPGRLRAGAVVPGPVALPMSIARPAGHGS
jgi:UDP-N-acetylglucosamine:LPS N-acetylglucosamine transferase